MRYQTSRLIVRPFELADAEAALSFYGDRDTMRYFIHAEPWATDISSATALMKRTQAYYKTHPGYGIFAVELRQGGLAGHSLLKPLGSDEVEVGWLIDSALRGEGLATEAAAGMLTHGFGVLRLEAIVAVMFPDNVPSRRVAERLGMAYQGTRPERGHTVAWYRLEREAFRKQK